MTIKKCREIALQYGWQCDVIREAQSAQAFEVANGRRDVVLFWRGYERRQFPRDEVKLWGIDDLKTKLGASAL